LAASGRIIRPLLLRRTRVSDNYTKKGLIMNDKSLKILLGIIAVNLTLQTINQIGLFPTAYAQSSGFMRVALCNSAGTTCADIENNRVSGRKLRVAISEGFGL